jgi:hypothetical protein
MAATIFKMTSIFNFFVGLATANVSGQDYLVLLYAAVTTLNLGLSRSIKPLQPVFWRMCSEHIYEMIL